ncbi:hypothetical protein V6N13_116592 [Hibiscus sabdariffa]
MVVVDGDIVAVGWRVDRTAQIGSQGGSFLDLGVVHSHQIHFDPMAKTIPRSNSSEGRDDSTWHPSSVVWSDA